MPDNQDLFNIEFFSSSKSQLTARCEAIATSKSVTLKHKTHIPVGASVELDLNTNELLGDDHDDIVLHGICSLHDNGELLIIFPELPEHPLFKAKKQPKKKKTFAPKQRRIPGQALSTAEKLKRHLHRHRTAASLGVAVIALSATSLLFWHSYKRTESFTAYPPSWQTTQKSGHVLVYDEPFLQSSPRKNAATEDSNEG